MKDLKNKKVLIIGGSGLIGRSITKYLLDQDCKVLNLDKKITNIKNKNYSFIKLDNSNENEEELIKIIIKKLKSIDCYVNASYPRTSDWIKNNFDEINFKTFKENLLMNTQTYIYFSNIIAKIMKKQNKGGSIVLLSSIYGFLGQNQNLYNGLKMRENLTYGFYKGGLINYVKQLAAFYGNYKIRVNSISPGGVEGHVAGKFSKIPLKFKKRYIEQVPLRRMAKPIDIAYAVEFLLSDKSNYITGTNLIVDGGYSII